MKKGLVEHFQSKKIEEIVGQGRTILYLKEDTPLKYALQELMRKDIRSAPLENQKQILFLDYECCLDFFIDSLRKFDKDLKNIHDHKQHIEEIFKTPISKVASKSSDKYAFIEAGSNAYDAGVLLAGGKSRLLVQKDGKVVNIITSSDFTHYILTHCGKEIKGDYTIKDLGLIYESPKVCFDTTRAIEVFAFMKDIGRSFIPIFSQESKDLVTVLSVRDMRILWKEDSSILDKSVMDYISVVRQASLDDRFPYFAIKPEEKFETSLKKLKAVRVNRLLVLNEKKEVLGALSVTGIVNFLFSK